MNKDRYNKDGILDRINSELRNTVLHMIKESLLVKMDEHVRLEWMYVVTELLRKARAGEYDSGGEIMIQFPEPEKFEYVFKHSFSDQVLLMLRILGFSAKQSEIRVRKPGTDHYHSVSVLRIKPYE